MCQIKLDDYPLPNVQSIKIVDNPRMSDKKVMRSLPRRTLIAKMGRVARLAGWTESEIAALRALANGEKRTFLHPSGDSFAVVVKMIAPDIAAMNVGRIIYELELREVR